MNQNKDFAQFVYSLVLIILIPALLIYNTIYLVQHFRANMDQELQQKAVLLSQTFSPTVLASIDSPDKLQNQIDKIITDQPVVKELTVYRLNADQFDTVASSNENMLGKKLTDVSSVIAWSQDQSTATLETAKNSKTGSVERVWSVLTPIHKDNGVDGLPGEKFALVNSKLSINDIDQLTTNTFSKSIYLLLGTIALILLLLLNHFRFIEYANLFRKLKEVDALKDDFLSIASHELKTPIIALKGYASMLQEGIGAELTDKGKVYVQNMIISANRLEELIKQTLDISRMEQGSLPFNITTCDPIALCQKVLENLSSLAQKKDLTLYHETPNSQIMIEADPDRFTQVVTNLVSNSIKYTQTGSLKISYRVKKRNLEILFKDTGIGMSSDALSHLFEKFYREHKEQTKEVQGTGLGLWITREMIKKMRGEISVESLEGEGTLFTVSLPLSSRFYT